MNPKYDVSIIIPVYNNLELTLGCLEAISENTHHVSYEVIVVDNGSTDGTQEALSGVSGDFQYLCNNENLGFSKANNQGAEKAKGAFLLFLNNDTCPEKGWLEQLVRMHQKDKKAGIIGAKMLYDDDTIQHCGLVWSNYSKIPYHLYLGMSRYHPAVNKVRTLQAVTGACMLIKKSLYMDVKGFDEDYINGGEDVDLCCKVRQKGLKVLYQPKAEIYHYESKTPGRGKFIPQNRDLLVRRWGKHFVHDDIKIYQEDGYQLDTYETVPCLSRYDIASVKPVISLAPGNILSRFKRVLVVKPSGIGNMILFLPALSILRTMLPEAIIDVACYPAEVPVISEHVDNIIICKKKDVTTSALDVVDLERKIADKVYDLAIYPPFSNLERPTLLLLHRISYHLFHTYVDFTYRHELEWNMDIVRKMGYDGEIPQAELPIEKVELPVTNLPRIGVHAGASISTHMQKKMWPKKYWIDLIRSLVSDYFIIFLGSGQEEEYAEDIIAQIPSEFKKNVFNSAGKFPLPQTFSIISQCHYSLNNDNGLMHAAAALKIPLIGIYGPTETNKSHPWGDPLLQRTMTLQLPCQPCYLQDIKVQCHYQACLLELKPQDVLKEFLDLVRFCTDSTYQKKTLRATDLSLHKDLITILIPTHNRPKELKKAIQSIISQSYPYWKLFILNDGGEDVSSVVNSFHDSRIRYFSYEKMGKSAVLNKALKEVETPYVGYLDDDDIHFENHLQVCLNALLVDPVLKMVYTDTYEITMRKGDDGDWIEAAKKIENVSTVSFDMLISKNYINHKNIVHQTSLIEEIGGYDETLRSLIDWDFIRRVFASTVNIKHVRQITGIHYLFVDKNATVQNKITGFKERDPNQYNQMLDYLIQKPIEPVPEVLAQVGKYLLFRDRQVLAYVSQIHCKGNLAKEDISKGALKKALESLKGYGDPLMMKTFRFWMERPDTLPDTKAMLLRGEIHLQLKQLDQALGFLKRTAEIIGGRLIAYSCNTSLSASYFEYASIFINNMIFLWYIASRYRPEEKNYVRIKIETVLAYGSGCFSDLQINYLKDLVNKTQCSEK